MPSATSPENHEPLDGPADPAGPTDHAGPADHAEPRGARRRALTWGAGALTFSVLTLGGFALTSAPAPDSATVTGAAAGVPSAVVPDAATATGRRGTGGMTNLTDEA
ncbi:hypothetical protein ACFWGN_04775 [Oerskovia sp. NPDC060338]|uniref:hypothetical protein n=1 Tax=Oerskovia sp. NPDC060338 TaxID=3347100 RepID=UPI00364B9BBF